MNKGSIQEMNTIGIDISKAKIDCAWLRESGKLKFKVFPNTKAGCKERVTKKGSSLAFCILENLVYTELKVSGYFAKCKT